MTDNSQSVSKGPIRKLVPIAVTPRGPTPAEAIRNILQNPLISVRLSKRAHAFLPQPVGGDVIAPDTLLFELERMLAIAERKLMDLAQESQRLGVAAERSDDRAKGLNLISALRQWVMLTAATRPLEAVEPQLQDPLVIPPEIERHLQELAVLGDRLAAWWTDAAARFPAAKEAEVGHHPPLGEVKIVVDSAKKVRVRSVAAGFGLVDVAISGPSLSRLFRIVIDRSSGGHDSPYVSWREIERAHLEGKRDSKGMRERDTYRRYADRILEKLKDRGLAHLWVVDLANGVIWKGPKWPSLSEEDKSLS
jgi:hypothetical protein